MYKTMLAVATYLMDIKHFLTAAKVGKKVVKLEAPFIQYIMLQISSPSRIWTLHMYFFSISYEGGLFFNDANTHIYYMYK